MNMATGAFGGAPNGATKRVRGVPKCVRWRHANPAITGAFGGAPYGARNRVMGVPKWKSMRGGGDDDEANMDGDDGDYDDDEEGGWMRGGGRTEGRQEGPGAPSIQNEDPTPQDG